MSYWRGYNRDMLRWIKHNIGLTVFIGLAIIIAFVIIPAVINEAYKAINGYITRWGASDVFWVDSEAHS